MADNLKREVGADGAEGEKRESYADKVAARIIEQLEQGTAPWQRPWQAGELRMPFNPTTNAPYRGFNAVWLVAQGIEDPRWMTYKQAAGAGAQVRKGEKGVVIQYAKFRGEEPMRDESGKPILDADGKQKTHMVEYDRPKVFHAVVFNATQIDGLPPLEVKPASQEWERHERCDAILQASGVPLRHVRGDRAYYSVRDDQITMPERDQFDAADKYYATALHELGHSTGHPTRLDRTFGTTFGSKDYAKEELRAELASLMLGERLEIGHDPGQHAAYVGSWIKALKEDPREIFRAAADAEKIASFVMGFEQQQTQTQAERDFESSIVGLMLEPKNDLARQVEHIDHAEFQRIQSVVDKMHPVDPATNDFWRRHQPPEDAQALEATIAAVGDALQRRDEAERPHYSNQTLQALVDDHGWQMTEGGSVVRQFEGVGPTGTMVTPGGERNLYAGYKDDPEERRYIGVTLADTRIADLDGRDAAPADIARLINLKAEQFADDRRVKQGLEPIYAAGSPALELPHGNPEKLQQEAEAVAKYDMERRGTVAQADARPVQIDREANMAKTQERTPLVVPYREKDQAKKAAADAGFKLSFDSKAKVWSAPAGVDLSGLAKWLPENRKAEPTPPKIDPKTEFADALRDAGFRLDEGQWLGQTRIGDTEPVMDGKRYRVAVEGDTGTERSGAYIGHLDGHPAGSIQNWRTGEKMNWKSSTKAEALSDVDRARLKAEAAEKLAAREAEQAAKHERIGRALEELIMAAPAAREDHPYLVKKGLEGPSLLFEVPQDGSALDPDSPVKIAKNGREAAELREKHPDSPVFTAGDLLVPAHDSNGNLTTVQAIGPDGRKANATGGKLAGSSYVAITGPAAERPGLGGGIVIAEGWATAATIQRECGGTVVAAFNAGNLEAVAKAIREKHPDRPIVIAGDNDHQKEREIDPRTGAHKENRGKTAAEAAAAAVGGYAAIPTFAADDKGTDWNDWQKENGSDALRKAMTESMLLADRRQLADAQRTGHDAERVSENVRLHQADAELGQGQEQGATSTELADAKSAFAALRNAGERERDAQDKSDELYNGQPAPGVVAEADEQEQQQTQDQEQKPQQKRSSGRKRGR